MKHMKKAGIFVGIVFILILLSLAGDFEEAENSSQLSASAYATTTVVSGDIAFVAQIADTDALRISGLSGRKSLASDEGMLFVFPASDFYGFWMKDMRFSIDIIGLNAKKEVVWLEEYMTPWSYPSIFTPPRPVLYVLEVKSGSISTLEISEGQRFSW